MRLYCGLFSMQIIQKEKNHLYKKIVQQKKKKIQIQILPIVTK